MATLTDEAKRTLDSVRDRIDNALDRLWTEQHEAGEPPKTPHRLRYGGPPVDVEETPEVVFVRAELPGMRPRDFTIKVSGNRVTVRGLKEEERKEDGRSGSTASPSGRSTCRRRSNRRAPLQPAYKDGVLRLMLPKTPRAKGCYLNVIVDWE